MGAVIDPWGHGLLPDVAQDVLREAIRVQATLGTAKARRKVLNDAIAWVRLRFPDLIRDPTEVRWLPPSLRGEAESIFEDTPEE